MSTKVDPARIKIVWQDPAMMQIGKSGVTDGAVRELNRLLKAHKYMKIRILRSALDAGLSKEQIVDLVCEKTGARSGGIRGNTAVIYKLKGMKSS